MNDANANCPSRGLAPACDALSVFARTTSRRAPVGQCRRSCTPAKSFAITGGRASMTMIAIEHVRWKDNQFARVTDLNLRRMWRAAPNAAKFHFDHGTRLQRW